MDTKQQILSVAQRLVQQRGVNGFSYADIAEAVGIRKASLHHHFPAKADLVAALIEGYTEQVQAELSRIAQLNITIEEKLLRYVQLYRQTLDSDCICLGGMLASEVQTLDALILSRLKGFFESHKTWLIEILTEGVAQQSLVLNSTPAVHAQMLLSALQGSLLIARATGDIEAFDQATALLISNLMRKG